MGRRTRNRRDASRIASAPQDRSWADPEPLALPTLPFQPAIRSPLTSVEDRRMWHPDPSPVARSSRRSRVPVHLPQAKRRSGPLSRSPKFLLATARSHYLTSGLTFRAPQYVAVCVRRKRRREVLFARGKGGGGKRPGRRNFFSNVRC